MSINFFSISYYHFVVQPNANLAKFLRACLKYQISAETINPILVFDHRFRAESAKRKNFKEFSQTTPILILILKEELFTRIR